MKPRQSQINSRMRVVRIEFEAVIELEDDRAALQARAFSEYIAREVNTKSIDPVRESFRVVDAYLAEVPK